MNIARIPALAGMTIGLLVVACKPPAPPKPALVQTLAVLPFDSEANNINAPDIMQRLVYEALTGSAYQPMDIDVVNKKLAEAGIVDGGMLAAVDPVKLGKDLNVQALMYGNVASFGYTNIGFYSQRKVVLELKLVDVATGDLLWENTGNGVTRNVAFDKDQASKNLVQGLADQLIDKASKNPLAPESRLATLQALRTLPGYAFTSFESDEKSINRVRNATGDLIKGFNKK